VLVLANLELQPEVSHNANVGLRIEYRDGPSGGWTLDLNEFLRESDRLVVLLGNDRTFAHQNVYKARGLRIENAASWLSTGRHVGVDGMLTWQDVRNTSNEGTLGDFEGDRIPNRPYLFASWGAHLRFDALPGLEDTLEPFYSGRCARLLPRLGKPGVASVQAIRRRPGHAYCRRVVERRPLPLSRLGDLRSRHPHRRQGV
jgi:hypothetical protein